MGSIGLDPAATAPIRCGVPTDSRKSSLTVLFLAAFIGAGGFGERISQGLALNDHAVLLAGALPAAVLALAVHGAFELAERSLGRGPR